eukprot:TRINITY_DN16514_c0_g2_i1.p3 TRINITY_DN16514_c0_g2~~TRINITY_DN16514_c0_g2_i1.p3  ORF type:complete len:105 (-),score=1.74 TRINITY_DN16514_c0_g2_i1:1365-1679(-)
MRYSAVSFGADDHRRAQSETHSEHCSDCRVARIQLCAAHMGNLHGHAGGEPESDGADIVRKAWARRDCVRHPGQQSEVSTTQSHRIASACGDGVWLCRRDGRAR